MKRADKPTARMKRDDLVRLLDTMTPAQQQAVTSRASISDVAEAARAASMTPVEVGDESWDDLRTTAVPRTPLGALAPSYATPPVHAWRASDTNIDEASLAVVSSATPTAQILVEHVMRLELARGSGPVATVATPVTPAMRLAVSGGVAFAILVVFFVLYRIV